MARGISLKKTVLALVAVGGFAWVFMTGTYLPAFLCVYLFLYYATAAAAYKKILSSLNITIAFHRSHWCLTVSTIWTLASACFFFGLWSSFASFLPSCSRSIHSFPS